jgi:hypothetical protein
MLVAVTLLSGCLTPKSKSSYGGAVGTAEQPLIDQQG